MCREHEDTSRMLIMCRRSCKMGQNASQNVQNKRMRSIHPRRLEMGQTSGQRNNHARRCPRLRERPRSVINERVDGTDAPDRDNGLGGYLDPPEDPRGIKVESDGRRVVDGANSRGHKESQRAIETDAQCRENGPGGHLGEQVKREMSRAIERD